MSDGRICYLESSLNQIPRLMALLDKEFLSPTCGSYDRPYWHHRTKDFSSAALQQGILSLALVWKHDLPKNPYFQSDYIFKLILHSFNFTEKIQKRDGSFDEWYWNERGWAGPTGYVLHAICQTYLLINESLNEEQKTSFKRFIRKSALFLIRSWEKDILANHIAMAILAVAESYKILQEEDLKEGLDDLIEKMGAYFYEAEGWSLEYDGADIGYQTGTISFLSRALAVYKHPTLERYCHTSMAFVSYFCAPDGNLATHIGSRQTANVFHYGFEYFNSNGLGSKLADFFYESLKKEDSLSPSSQEDHYLIYRIPELLESYLISQGSKSPIHDLLPFEKDDFDHEFKLAGIYIKNYKNFYTIFSPKRGGCLQIFNKDKRTCEIVDVGLSLKLQDGSVWSTLWIDPNNIFEIHQNQWRVEVALKKMSYPVFNPFKMIVFRVLSAFFGVNEQSSYYFKHFIRKILMTNLKRSNLSFKRTITFSQGQIMIDDELDLKDKVKKVHSLLRGGIFFTRVIPQTKYFYNRELKFMAMELKSKELKFTNGKIINRVTL